MPRNLSPAVQAAIAAPQKRMAWLVEIVFATETVWLWGGIGPLSAPGPAWDSGATFPYGKVFTGLGWLGQISELPQNTETTAQNMVLQLAGIAAELIGDVINAVRLSGAVTLWLAFFDQNNTLLPDPLQMWQGATDVPTMDDSVETSTVSITVENALLALNLASNRRFTSLDQQLDFPGDTGFDYVTAMQDLYLPYPVGIVAATKINSNNLDAAPNWSSGLTIAPSGAQKLRPGGALQVAATAQFVTGPFADGRGLHDVTALGLWSSSDTAVATVTNGYGGDITGGGGNFGTGGGLITAHGPGNCTITFFFGQVSCSLTVSVA